MADTSESGGKGVGDWVARVHDQTLPPEEVIKAYDQWAQGGVYDQQLSDTTTQYGGQQMLCDAVAAVVPAAARPTFRILDVAAGSGLTGQQLRDRGFCRLDALDPSPGMLEEARKKGVYQNFICDYITEKPSNIPENTYDGVTVVGGFGPGHIPKSALYEMARLVKPGGYVMFVICEDHLANVKDYGDLLPFVDDLERQGRWTKIRRETYEGHLGDRRGIIFIYQVLQ